MVVTTLDVARFGVLIPIVMTATYIPAILRMGPRLLQPSLQQPPALTWLGMLKLETTQPKANTPVSRTFFTGALLIEVILEVYTKGRAMGQY